MDLTDTQLAILALIAERLEAEGMPPSQAEIAKAFGFKGVRAAQYHLEALEQAGAIERMFRQIATERGALCLLGGGAADSFAGLLDIPLRRIDNLVLCGLAVIAGLHSPNA